MAHEFQRRDATPFLAWLMSCIVRNHLGRTTLVAWKIVPAIRLHWCRHWQHRKYSKVPRLYSLCSD